MGDVGSLFLGFMTAMFIALDVASASISPWQGLILIAGFATDGTVTLLRRAWQGEAIMTAHRRHAYQQLARRFASHRRVVLGFAAANLLWLLPLAVAVPAAGPAAPALVLVAYAPLAAAALVAGAGRPEHA